MSCRAIIQISFHDFWTVKILIKYQNTSRDFLLFLMKFNAFPNLTKMFKTTGSGLDQMRKDIFTA